MGKFEDLTGKRFGKLVVVEKERKVNKTGKSYVWWKCVCDCGNITHAYTSSLKSCFTKSCGCWSRERSTKHGGKGTRLYTIWIAMKARCKNPRRPEFHHYGGRGISVCQKWSNDFGAFRDWALTHGYTPNLTLDRIDVNGDYCPENCKWSTYIEQGNNKRNTIKISAFGETHTITEWSELRQIPATAIQHRVRYGWDAERIVSTPSQRGGSFHERL